MLYSRDIRSLKITRTQMLKKTINGDTLLDEYRYLELLFPLRNFQKYKENYIIYKFKIEKDLLLNDYFRQTENFLKDNEIITFKNKFEFKEHIGLIKTKLELNQVIETIYKEHDSDPVLLGEVCSNELCDSLNTERIIKILKPKNENGMLIEYIIRYKQFNEIMFVDIIKLDPNFLFYGSMKNKHDTWVEECIEKINKNSRISKQTIETIKNLAKNCKFLHETSLQKILQIK